VAELVARIIQERLKLAPGQVDWFDDFFGCDL
jgi:hypothetical protein